MPYVIQRLSDCLYVSPPGCDKSYTPILENAQTYATREDANRDCYGNETVLDVASILRPPITTPPSARRK